MRQGARTDKKGGKGVTPEKVLVWALRKSNVPASKVAKILDISPQTTTKYFKDMENFVGQDFDAKMLRQNLMGLYGKAVIALEKLLDDCNPQTVNNYLIGQGIWVKEQKHDIPNLGAATPDELKRQLVELGVPIAGQASTSDSDS